MATPTRSSPSITDWVALGNRHTAASRSWPLVDTARRMGSAAASTIPTATGQRKSPSSQALNTQWARAVHLPARSTLPDAVSRAEARTYTSRPAATATGGEEE